MIELYSRYFISFNDNALYISYREREIRSRNHQHIQQKPIFIIIYTYIYISVNFPVWLEPGWFSVRSPHCLQERKKSTGNIPKPGDPGYISSTAIRQKNRNNLCGSKVTLHVYHVFPPALDELQQKCGRKQNWYKRKHSARYESVVNRIFLHMWDAQDPLLPSTSIFIPLLCNIVQTASWPGCWSLQPRLFKLWNSL